MKAEILRGSKQEIAERVIAIDGEVREAIIFIEGPPQNTAQPPNADIFAEMEPFMAKTGNVDYSREGLYSPADDE